MINVMLDIETLSTQSNACIVSIGAVKVDKDNIIDEFYINLDPFEGKSLGLHIDPDTIAWWKTQSSEAQKAWQSDPQPYAVALAKFSDWYGKKSVPTWAKGGHKFDYPILENAFKVVGLPTPFKYWHCFDYRTLLHVVKIDDRKLKQKGSTYHNALDDSKEQAKLLMPILVAFDNWEAF